MEVAVCLPDPTAPRLTPQIVDPGATSATVGQRGRRWSDTRAFVLSRDRGNCRYCGSPAVHVDHIVPVRAGGSDDPSNLVAACRDCNMRKGCKLFDSFEAAKLWLAVPENRCNNRAHWGKAGPKRTSWIEDEIQRKRLEDDLTHGYMGSEYTKQEYLSIQRAKAKRRK